MAKNSSGEDEHEVRVDILAPPARPSGPVQVYKVARQTNIFKFFLCFASSSKYFLEVNK